MASATENRFINLYINGRQAGETLNEVRSRHRRLTAEINRGKLSQQQYNEKVRELQRYQGILEQHRDKIRGVNRSWQQLKTVALGVVGGNLMLTAFQKITQFIPNMINRNADLSDSFADVRKTTGLSSQEVEVLYGRLKKFDTRTARKELLDLARDAGKLGIQGIDNIASFVKAADQINVSLGEDLGEGAIRQIGKLNNLFKVSEVYGYEQGLLKIGSVINELGAGSEAAESQVVDFVSRLAGVATQANINIESLAAYGATLDSLGQRTETSATAISQAIVGMFKDTETYAGIAGMSVQDFSALLEKDANEAFIAFLKGLDGNNAGLTALAGKFDQLGIDGSRAISVLGALAGNTAKLRDQQELANKAFAEGTSLTNEFNIKNNNLAGTLDKIGKRLGSIWINSGLVNGINKMVLGFEKLIRLPVDEEIKKQRMSTLFLANEIYRLNIGSEERIKKINQLKAEFPNIMGNINAETASNRELVGVMREVNAEYVKRILLARKQEDLADLQLDIEDSIAEEAEQMNTLNTKREAMMQDLSEKEETIFRSNEQAIVDHYRYVQAQNEGHVTKVMAFKRALQKIGISGMDTQDFAAFERQLAEYERLQAERVKLEEQYAKEIARVNKLASSFRESTGGDGKVGTSTGDESQAAETAGNAELKQTQSILDRKLELIKQAAQDEMLYLEQHRAEQLISAELFEEEMLSIKLSSLLLQLEALKRSGKDTVAVQREIAQTQIQLNESVAASEERKAKAEEEAAKDEEDAADKKNDLLNQEAEARREAELAAIQSNFMRGVSAVEGARTEQEAAAQAIGALRALVKEYAAQAIAAATAELFVKLGPAGLFVAPVVGAAISAMFDRLIPRPQNPNIQEFAEGTTHFGGNAIVGDQGRELVNLPKGSQVIPADTTQQILAANAFSNAMPQPNFAAINDGLSYSQGKQAQSSAVGGKSIGYDLGPLLKEMQAIRVMMSMQRHQKVTLSQFDVDRFNERYKRNAKSVGLIK